MGFDTILISLIQIAIFTSSVFVGILVWMAVMIILLDLVEINKDNRKTKRRFLNKKNKLNRHYK